MPEATKDSFEEYKKLKWDTENEQRNFIDFYTEEAWSAFHQGKENEAIDHYLKAKKLSEIYNFKPRRLIELKGTVEEMIRNRNDG